MYFTLGGTRQICAVNLTMTTEVICIEMRIGGPTLKNMSF